MTPDQFWNSEPYIFFAYEKAYITRLHNESHIRGLYIYNAFSIVMAKAFSKNSSSAEYPKEPIFSPYTKEYQMTKKFSGMSVLEKDKVYREKMARWKVH